MQDTLQAPRSSARATTSAAYPDTELLAPATQLVSDKDAYLGNAGTDIGQRVSDEQLELFVVCHPVEALRQQLERLTPQYIAIHDVASASSTRLLSAVAAAASCKLQRLVIRRQGYGVALATLQFVELTVSPQRKLRVYTTQIDADTQTRQQLAQLLLAHSRLGVVMVGELPPHALASSLQSLREAIAAGPWPNRNLLLVPLAPAPTLAAQAVALAGSSGVMVRTTPQAGRAEQAWSYVTGTWSLINPRGPRQPASTPAPTPTPMPRQARASATRDARTDLPAWQQHVSRCAAIEGVRECGVIDLDHERVLAHFGPARDAERLAAKSALLQAACADCTRALGLGVAAAEIVITLAQQVLLLCPLAGHPRLMQYLLLDRAHGADIAALRIRLQRIGSPASAAGASSTVS